MLNLVYIWWDDTYWSKVLFTTIPTLARYLKIKVPDVDLLIGNFNKLKNFFKNLF